MTRTTPQAFLRTPEGRAFLDLYDAVVARWPDAEATELESSFGVTRVISSGPADAPPVVLLPGSGATAASWFAAAPLLARSMRVHAVDLMGDAGRSVPSASRLRTTTDLVGWLDSVVDGLGLAATGLVGHSYGAQVALAYAVHHPDRVDNLALVDPTGCFAGLAPRYLMKALPVLLAPTAARERRLLAWESDGVPLDESWVALAAHAAEHFPAARPVVPRRPSREVLRALPIPTTVVLAGRSRAHDSAKVATAVRDRMPAAHLEVLPDASHHGLPVHPAGDLAAVLTEALAPRT